MLIIKETVLITNKYIKYIIIITCIITLFMIIFSYNFNTLKAVTNSVYGMDEEATVDLTKSASKSKLLNAIGRFVYAIAAFIENIVAKIFSDMVGSRMFPWADKIIFNSIPFLDVNFISPEPGSLFLKTDGKTNTIIGTVIQEIYYMIYTISVSFLGIAVGVMAIKLVISSIAEDKAKYKELLKKWGIALLLVFTIHYLISFVFWVNEKVVEIASNILLSSTQNVKLFELNINTEYMILNKGKIVKFNIETNQFERSREDATDIDISNYEYNYDVPANLSESIVEMYINEANRRIENEANGETEEIFSNFDARKWMEEQNGLKVPDSDPAVTMKNIFDNFKNQVLTSFQIVDSAQI